MQGKARAVTASGLVSAWGRVRVTACLVTAKQRVAARLIVSSQRDNILCEMQKENYTAQKNWSLRYITKLVKCQWHQYIQLGNKVWINFSCFGANETVWSETHTSGLLEVVFYSLSAAPVPPRTKEQVTVVLLGWCPSAALSSSYCVMAHLLIYPHTTGSAGRQQNLRDSTYGRAILENLDYLLVSCYEQWQGHINRN